MNIGVLASHNGTNLQAIVDACESGELDARVAVVISNNSRSGAMDRARNHSIPSRHVSGITHPDPEAADRAICEALETAGVDVVFLAGYMKRLGPVTLARFRGRVLNTHPALLPRFGGQGMYGERVHEAVLAARESESGASIHLVDADYDTGPVIAQCRVPVEAGDTPDTLAARVQTNERRLVVDTLARIRRGEIRLA